MMAIFSAGDSDSIPPATETPPLDRRWAAAAFAAMAIVGLGNTALGPSHFMPPAREVVDVTQLVHIPVERVATPTSTDDVIALVSSHDGPISIGGGRFSMGGQIATENTLFLDTRALNDVLTYDPDAMTITVEAGITWRKIQDHIDGDDLSIKIMQSYANFTVGGSISVNAHGRYVNRGPVAHSIRAFDLVLADGSRHHCTRDQNAELFHAAIGGYGGLGVITEVELDLEPNYKVERTIERMTTGDFLPWFDKNIRDSETAVFFNADLYPPNYDEMVAITFSKTDREVTEKARLQSGGESSSLDKFAYWWVSEAPLGKQARRELIDRMRLKGKPVVYRNYEASYDVYGLEPGSRDKTTYVLQEYFIPTRNFDAFVPTMAEIYRRYKVNVVNVSIRHASADPDTMLTWAREEVYAFVIYYKQGTTEADKAEVGIWTREMTEAIIEAEGSYYLPYQLHPTTEQFHRSYPRGEDFFDLKMRLDPAYKFRNKLWDQHLPAAGAIAAEQAESSIRANLHARADYLRPEDQTFLTLPEWYIVYSADELGTHLADKPQSTFPFFASIGQFWTLYDAVSGTTDGRYPTNTGYHSMIWVIGVSYTVEYVVKGLYEGSVGQLTEWWSGDGWKTNAQDRYYATVASDYGHFIHHTPWYAFPFGERRGDFWAADNEKMSIRGLERSVSVWVELATKSAWGGLMGWGSGAAYGEEIDVIQAWVQPGDVDLSQIEGIEVLEDLGESNLLLSMPRYEPFSIAVPTLAEQGVEFIEIAGGKTIVVQVISDVGWNGGALWGDVLLAWPILTEPGRKRVAIEVPVRRLDEVIPQLKAAGVQLEHIYDY
jgi:FAD/FMN-containing dehydrogenase